MAVDIDKARKAKQRIEWQLRWKESTPSNEQIAEAFSSHENLGLYCIVNTAEDEQFISASSELSAMILSRMSGHIQAIGNGRSWKAYDKSYKWTKSFLRCAQEVVDSGYLGLIYPDGEYAVTREGIFGPDTEV